MQGILTSNKCAQHHGCQQRGNLSVSEDVVSKCGCFHSAEFLIQAAPDAKCGISAILQK